ncbi:MAG: ATP-dependent helicase, partial [Candidatus Limnocylindrales bacterium]
MDLGRFPDTLDVRRGANPPTRASRPDAPVSLDTVAGLLQGLNAEQKRAVTHGDGPLLVVAGPGTGKTQVITRRVAWLIATKRARPSEILALTFTDRAAAEMQGRVDQLVPYGYADTAIHTFHAFGDRLIREFAFELGLPDEPRLLSRADVVVFLRDRLFELELDRYRPLGNPTRFLGALADLFSRARDEDISPEAYAAFAGGLEREARRAQSSALDPAARAAAEALMERAAQQVELGRAYARYLELLGAGGCVDHGSQLALAVRLLRDHPAVRAELERRYRYVLVDEFQDTNAAQLALLGLLCTARRSITAVGDDDQSIYTFRGAAEANAQRFPERFPGARRIFLRRNYRSRAPILEAAGRLIANNGTALDPSGDRRPPLRAHRRGGTAQAVEQRAFATVADEADWIAATVADRLTAPGARPQDFAVLVRTNAEAEPVLRSLNLRGVPWRFSGVSRLYARPEIRALLCFLRAVADLDSTIDLYGVATAAPYGLGGTDLTILLEHGRRSHRSLWQSCCELIEQPRLLRVSTATRERVTRLVADFKAASSLAHDKPAGDVLYAHLKR